MLRRVALVRTDVSEEPSSSFIRVTRIGELGTALAATSNRRTLRRFLQEPHGVTSQKAQFFKLLLVETEDEQKEHRNKDHTKETFAREAMPCGSCKNRRFGGTYRFHHQNEKNKRSRNVN
jgi:hypothetical protein